MNHENWLGDGSEITTTDESDNNNNSESFRSVSTDNNETNYQLDFTGGTINNRKTSTKHSKMILRDVVETPKSINTVSKTRETPKTRRITNNIRKSAERTDSSGIIDDVDVNESVKVNPTSKSRPSISKINEISKKVVEEDEEDDQSSEKETSSSDDEQHQSLMPVQVPKKAIQSGKLHAMKKSLGKQIHNKRKQSEPKKRDMNILKKIAKLQSQTNNLIPKLNFSRLVKEVMQEVSNGEVYRVTPEFLMALQESSELYLVHFFSDAYLCTTHRGRITLIPKDMQLALRLRGITDPGV